MKNKIDWLNHSLEFVVVLIGILIAFQLNKCSDNKAKGNLIDNHLEYISFECRENGKKLLESIEHSEGQIKNCDSILLEISTTKEVIKIRSLSTKLLDLRNVDLTKNAYEVLAQSGDIRFLKDYEQKKKIITLYDSFERVERINTSNQNLYDNHFYPYLKSNFDLVNWNYIDLKSEKEGLPYTSKEFSNIVSTYKYLLNAKLNVYNNELRLIDEYLKTNN